MEVTSELAKELTRAMLGNAGQYPSILSASNGNWSQRLVKALENKKISGKNKKIEWRPAVDGIPITELPITYGRSGRQSVTVKMAVSTYVRIKNAKEKLKRYCIF